jgi:hypothetical protein
MRAEWFALAPRYLYMIAPGAALLWTAPLVPVFRNSADKIASIFILLFVLAGLVPAVVSVRHGVQLTQMACAPIWEASHAAEWTQPLLLVNMPMRITPTERFYPLGFEGVTPLPKRVTADDLIFAHTGLRDGGDAVAFGVVAVDRPTSYGYELAGDDVGWDGMRDALNKPTTVFLTQYLEEAIELTPAGAVERRGRHSRTQADVVAQFGQQIVLAQAHAVDHGDGWLEIESLWHVVDLVDTDVVVFAHLVTPAGETVAQADGRLLLGLLPFWLLDPQNEVKDLRRITIDGQVCPVGYTVRLGIWEPATGRRWPVRGTEDDYLGIPIACQPRNQNAQD